MLEGNIFVTANKDMKITIVGNFDFEVVRYVTT